jgi:hypothetical protein
MKITELTGYRGNAIYRTAKSVFKDKEPGERYSPEYSTRNRMQVFTEYLERYGFVRLGHGSYGTVYEKSGYPWVFKIFKNDPAYLYYVKYIKDNQANANVPRIKGHTIAINDDTYAVRMEKLSPPDEDIIEDLEYMAGILSLSLGERPVDVEPIIEAYPGIYKIFTDLIQSGYRLDVHEDNIMMRGNVPVITDPVA